MASVQAVAGTTAIVMLIKKSADVLPSEITSESLYRSRRKFLVETYAVSALVALPTFALPEGWVENQGYVPNEENDEGITPLSKSTRFNNFYEFGASKTAPFQKAGRMTTHPWSIEVTGLVNKPGTVAIEDLLRGIDLEERIYRLRCVEAWSMVIPWIGFPVKKILDRFEPQGSAKFVQFTTLKREEEMPGISLFSSIDFPYIEGLRLDEANHPLTIFAVGMYGKNLLNQNGAPFRLVVPWKYGFKSIKSIVKIELTEKIPSTTWNLSSPQEYGFYANVNPQVHHRRWRQSHERRLGSSWFPKLVDTRLFNGYSEVAPLYYGMNLKHNY